MGFNRADQQINAFGAALPRRGEHRIGFTDAGTGSEKYFQTAAPTSRFLVLYLGEQGIRIGPSFHHGPQPLYTKARGPALTGKNPAGFMPRIFGI
ncbi:MAG TPA: hypothetical protein VMI47_05680 [Pseudolabrys sp.]|nr:hypothetical protein [Pseudolabrys sp.]